MDSKSLDQVVNRQMAAAASALADAVNIVLSLQEQPGEMCPACHSHPIDQAGMVIISVLHENVDNLRRLSEELDR